MNAKQFKYVLVLSNEGSFSKAAEILNITQPSLSQYIKKIEKEIGMELFDRTNGNVRITDAGRIYIETARKILDLEHQMENAFNDLVDHKTGSLVIGAAPYRAAAMIPVIASEFKKDYPGMHLVVREGTTAELLDGLEHGEYDLALTLLPDDRQLFDYEKVMEEELVLAVPSGYPVFETSVISDRKHPAIDAERINGQPFVMLTDVQYMQRQMNSLVNRYNLSVYTAGIVKSLEAQIEMVKAGIGLALMPSGIERFCRAGEVSFYSFADPLPKREVVVMWRKEHAMSAVAKELIKTINSISW